MNYFILVVQPMGFGPMAIITFFFIVAAICWFIASVKAGEALIINHPAVNRIFRKIKYGEKAKRRIAGDLSDFSYFNSLSENGKNKFIDRVTGLLISKEFTGREGLAVTETMRVHIAACAVQLTFGKDDFLFSKFDSFDLHPNSFRSTWDSPANEGAISSSGIIALSMKDWEEGYKIANDNKNLGLYEMAQAFLLQLIDDIEDDKELSEKVFAYQSQADVIFEKLKSKHTFLENDAFKNKKSFFAVCVVHFFETPEDFKKNIPVFYTTLCELLNQNPLSSKEDYVIASRAV